MQLLNETETVYGARGLSDAYLHSMYHAAINARTCAGYGSDIGEWLDS